MKRSPDLILILVIAFVVGAVMTGVAQSDFQFASLVQNVIRS